jgi:hypothetical protein
VREGQQIKVTALEWKLFLAFPFFEFVVGGYEDAFEFEQH